MKNLLEKSIRWLSPRWAAQRQKDRHILASYEGASYNRSRSQNPYISPASANTEVQMGGETLLQQARELERNHDLVSGALDMLVAQIVGAGLQTEPMVCEKKGKLINALNEEIKSLWERWLKSPDITGQMSGGKIQQLDVRSWLRDGGTFKKVFEGYDFPHQNNVLPFSIGCYEYDYVPFHHTRTLEKGRIVQGIEVNEYGAPLAFWMYPSHPGDYYADSDQNNLVRHSIFDTYHIAQTKRFGQLRGVTAFHPIFTRLEDVREYDRAERMAQKIAASSVWQLLTDNDSPVAEALSPNDATNNQADLEIRPGLFLDQLYPGQRVEMIKSDRPSNEQSEFRKSQLRCAASGIGMTYSYFMREFDGSYSSERQSTSLFYELCRPITENYKWEWDKIYKHFLKAAILYGKVKIPINKINLDTLFRASHRGPGMTYIDPAREAKAKEVLLGAGLKSRSSLIREAGENPSDIDRERSIDLDREKELGLKQEPTTQPQTQNVENDKQKPK